MRERAKHETDERAPRMRNNERAKHEKKGSASMRKTKRAKHERELSMKERAKYERELRTRES